MGFRYAPKGKIFQDHQEIRIRSPEIGRFLTNASGGSPAFAPRFTCQCKSDLCGSHAERILGVASAADGTDGCLHRCRSLTSRPHQLTCFFPSGVRARSSRMWPTRSEEAPLLSHLRWLDIRRHSGACSKRADVAGTSTSVGTFGRRRVAPCPHPPRRSGSFESS